MTSRPHVLIVGCGYVGAALAARLVAAGHRVTGVRRSDAHPLPEGVAQHLADVTAPDLALPGCDALVYAVSAGGFSEDRYRAAYVDGLANTLDALARTPQGLPALGLFVSSTGVYAQADGSLVDETSPTEPHSFSGQLMLAGERLCRGRLSSGVAVRLAGIYGPGRTRFVESVRDATARMPQDPAWTNRIHRDDCAGVLHHLIARWQQGHALDPVYLGVDDEPARYDEVVRWLAARLDVPVPPPAAQDESSGRETRRRPRTDKRCSNARIKASGYRFAFPSYREGYAALIEAGLA